MACKKKCKKGFTLIELMIVVAIIGILAAIAIPRFADMLEKAREGATKGNLAAIRSAITIYYSEKEGLWPDDLTTAFTSYLYPIPQVKCTRGTPQVGPSNAVTLLNDIPAGAGVGWGYVTGPQGAIYQGNLFVNSTDNDTKGVSYTTY